MMKPKLILFIFLLIPWLNRALPQYIVINEINYNSSVDFNPEDWLELYNPSTYSVNLAGWEFRDEEDIHGFVFPAGTVLPPDGYLVLCADTLVFHSFFPEADNYTGNFLFGLSGGGELLRLYDSTGLLIDTVRYDDVFPWPPDADGLGPTLELIDPDLDNALPESWMASAQHGTPGWENGLYTAVQSPPDAHSFEVSVLPNPFREQLSFLISTEEDLTLTVCIYDLMGNTLMEASGLTFATGDRIISWDGMAEDGRAAGRGIYFCRISSENECIILKLIKTE